MNNFSDLGINDFNDPAENPENDSTIPAGQYRACITDSEIKATKAGDGKYLKLKFQVLEGQCQNRVLFVNLNIVNPNQDAVRMGKADLKKIREATGVLNPQSSEELHDKPMLITVTRKPRKDNPDEFENRITKYESGNGVVTQAPRQQQATTVASGPVQSPWAKQA